MYKTRAKAIADWFAWRNNDRGVSAIIVGAALVGLLGMGAYVIDAGSAFEERRDLQNGADAAALGAAIDCAGSGICSSGAAQPAADSIASLNANDGFASVAASEIVFGAGEVTVTARTETSSGGSEIPYALASVLGVDGKAVEATATATWGTVGSAVAIPITFSSCEWSEAMMIPDPINNPPTAADFPTAYRIIHLHDDNDASQCAFGPGQDVDGDGDRNEGGFGYLNSSNCSATITVGGYVQGQTGAGNPGSLGCSLGDILGQTLLVPIFDDIPASGTVCGAPPGQPCYHIFGFAAFEVHDVDLTGNPWRNNGNICTGGNQRCIGGYFVDFLTLEEGLAGGPSNPPNLGITSVTLSG